MMQQLACWTQEQANLAQISIQPQSYPSGPSFTAPLVCAGSSCRILKCNLYAASFHFDSSLFPGWVFIEPIPSEACFCTGFLLHFFTNASVEACVRVFQCVNRIWQKEMLLPVCTEKVQYIVSLLLLLLRTGFSTTPIAVLSYHSEYCFYMKIRGPGKSYIP